MFSQLKKNFRYNAENKEKAAPSGTAFLSSYYNSFAREAYSFQAFKCSANLFFTLCEFFIRSIKSWCIFL